MVVITIVTFLAIFLAGNLLFGLQRWATHWWSDTFWTLAALATALRCFAASRRKRPDYRTAWRFFGAGCLAWFLGMLAWDYLELVLKQATPFPALSDLGYLGLAPLFVAGMFFYTTKTSNVPITPKLLGTLGMVLSAVIIDIVVALYAPLQNMHEPLFYQSVALAYPVLYLAAVFFGATSLWLYVRGPGQWAFSLLLLGLAVHAGVDTVYAYAILKKTYEAGQHLDIFWLIGFGFIYWAAFEDSIERAPARSRRTIDWAAQNLEIFIPAGAILSIAVVAYFFRAYLSEPLLKLLFPIALLFIATLTLREWWTHRLSSRLYDEVADSTRELTAILDSMQDTFIRTDSNGRILRASPSMTRLLGYQPGELIGSFATVLYAQPCDFDNLKTKLETGGGEIENFEAQLLHKNGSVIWTSINAHSYRDAAGLEGTIRDITTRRAAEEQLRIKDNAVASSLTPIAMADLQATVTYVNAAFIQMWGYQNEARILGQSGLDFFDSREAATAALNQLRRDGRWHGELAARRRDGSVFTVQLAANMVSDREGMPACLMASFVDITERIAAEDALRQSEERFSKAFHASPAMMVIATLDDGRVIDINESFLRTMDYRRDDVIEHTTRELNLWADPTERVRFISSIRQTGSAPTREAVLRMRSGKSRHVLLSAQLLVIDDESCIIGVATDVTENLRAAEQMQKLSRALEQTADSVIVTERTGKIEYVNRAFETVTGYSAVEALGNTPAIVKSGRHNDVFYRRLWETILNGKVFRDVLVNRRKDGTLYYEEKTITPLKDASGNITHFVSTGKDITDRMQTQERLQHLAHHDVLTDLGNRFLFIERLDHALERARRHGLMIAVLFLDLDRFKIINDTLGHEVGDKLLQEVARRLRQCVRRDDTVARLGGDEFTLLLEDFHSTEHVSGIARKLLASLAKPFNIDNRELFISASIGISLFPEDGTRPSALLKNADAAMYLAKDRGRNTYQFYSAEIGDRVSEQLALETDLRHAAVRNEFVLYYQPLVSLESGRIKGVEALIRWNHPHKGLVMPLRFIPLLEETGMIVEIGEWILRTACTQNQAWLKSGLNPLLLSINLSARQFHEPGIVDLIQKILAETGMPAQQLEVEITESVIMQHLQSTVDKLQALHAMGVKLAIDDFGTGYSSLSYLKRFPLDTLKVDKSFVDDLPLDPEDTAITRAVIAMAHGLKLEVIAEGVETSKQLEFLRENGCDGIQGYFFSKPLPAEAITQLLRADRCLPAPAAARSAVRD